MDDRGRFRGVSFEGDDAKYLFLAATVFCLGRDADDVAGIFEFATSLLRRDPFPVTGSPFLLLFPPDGAGLTLGGAFTSRNSDVMLDNFELK